MINFLNQLINGLSLGTFYALIALGYTMVYGVLRFINFAHGDIFMIGAFVGYYTAGRVVPLFGGRYVLLGIVGLVLGQWRSARSSASSSRNSPTARCAAGPS